jgi:hypothetical protein
MIQIEDKETGHHQNFFTGGELCKLIQLRDNKGKLLGRNSFYKRLKTDKYMLQDGTLPQSWLSLDMGIMYTTLKKGGGGHKYILPLWSEKGVQFLKNKYHVEPVNDKNFKLPKEKLEIMPVTKKCSGTNDTEAKKQPRDIGDELLEVIPDDQFESEMVGRYGKNTAAYQIANKFGETGIIDDDKI